MGKFNEGDKLLLSVRETMALLGLSRNAIYSACHRGQLPVLRVGKRFWISKLALLKLLEEGPLNLTPASK